MATIATTEKLFKAHVYDQAAPQQIDFRQHRYRLYDLLARGEEIALGLLALQTPALDQVTLVDRQLETMRNELWEWHGPADDPALPESLREGMAQGIMEEGLEPMNHSTDAGASGQV